MQIYICVYLYKFTFIYVNSHIHTHSYTLLFERGGTQLSNKDLTKKKIEKSRWIFFSDDQGVYGNVPHMCIKVCFCTF